MFTVEQGTALLGDATKLPAGADAAAVGFELGWLPLGLAQAAAYITLNQYSYRIPFRIVELGLNQALQQQAGATHPAYCGHYPSMQYLHRNRLGRAQQGTITGIGVDVAGWRPSSALE